MADGGNTMNETSAMPGANTGNNNQLQAVADIPVPSPSNTNAPPTAGAGGAAVKQESVTGSKGAGGKSDDDSDKNGDEDVPMTFPQRVSSTRSKLRCVVLAGMHCLVIWQGCAVADLPDAVVFEEELNCMLGYLGI